MAINVHSKFFQNKILNKSLHKEHKQANLLIISFRKKNIIFRTPLLYTQPIVNQSRNPRNLLMCDTNLHKQRKPSMFQIQSWCTNFPYTTTTVNLMHSRHQTLPTGPRYLICAHTKPFIQNVLAQVSISTDYKMHGYLINYFWMWSRQ